MPEYVLTRGQPRTTADRSRAVYETKRLWKECADAAAAIQWAREVTPDAVPTGNTQFVVPAALRTPCRTSRRPEGLALAARRVVRATTLG